MAMMNVSCGRHRRGFQVSIAVLSATLFLVVLYSPRERLPTSNSLVKTTQEQTVDLSLKEVYAELEHMLSTENLRARCQSTIYPGGKCSCVDATPGDQENCMMVPIMDGKKTVCLDEGLLRPGQPCLVYSFGIRDDLSFETEMVRFGCTVHAFDPTMRLSADTKLPAGLHVHYIGIDGHSWTHRASGHDFRLMSLDELVRHLGHQGRRIDYLKLDAEGSEWAVLRDQLSSGATLRRLPQFTVELHLMFPRGTLSADPSRRHELSRDDALDFLESLRRLEAAGFRLLESRPDHAKYGGTNISYIYETTWIRQQ